MTFKNIYPTDDWKIILEMNDSTLRLLNYRDLNDEFSFCAFPNQLKAFRFSENEIVWKNGKSLDLKTSIDSSKLIELSDVINSSITIGMKNQAPTDKDSRHHVYYATLSPFNKEKPVMIGESIGGGHTERGGCRPCSIEELLGLPNWKSHFELADCNWAIEMIEKNHKDSSKVIESIMEGIRNRSNFN